VVPELRQCVESVLLGRKALEAASFDISTQRELVGLGLAHLHTLIMRHSDVTAEWAPWPDEDLLRDMHRARFGPLP
jgi:hypothetical protein